MKKADRSGKATYTASTNNAVRAVNTERVMLYWNIGRHIIEDQQQGNYKAEYGKAIISSLADELTKDFGTGFSFRQLNYCRQFFLAFPKVNALRSQLNWTQYRLLLSVEDLFIKIKGDSCTYDDEWHRRYPAG